MKTDTKRFVEGLLLGLAVGIPLGLIFLPMAMLLIHGLKGYLTG